MKKAFAILLLVVASCGASPAGEYYVSKAGNDSWDGLSWGTSKSNLQGFAQSLSGTNTVNIGAGDWQMTNTHLMIPANTTLKGTNRETVVLIGSGTNRVIYGNNVFFTLDSLTVSGGLLTNLGFKASGAGVYALTTKGMMTNCRVVGNVNGTGSQFNQGGGGVGNMYIKNSIIESNYCNGNGGGAWFCSISNSIVRGNIAQNSGGVGESYSYGSSIESNNAVASFGGGTGYFYDSIISNNTASTCGGISATLAENCIIANNYALSVSGGFQGNLNKCTVINNVSANIGGAGASGTMIGCNVISNSAPSSIMRDIVLNDCFISGNISGAYLAQHFASPAEEAFNCVIVSNISRGVFYNYGGVYGCTILNNVLNAGYTNLIASASAGIVANNILWSNSHNSIGGTTNLFSNLLSVDPLFLNDGSYKLQQTSPAIDAGNDTYALSLNDFYGRARIYGARVDIGATEWSPLDIPIYQTNGKKSALLKFMEQK